MSALPPDDTETAPASAPAAARATAVRAAPPAVAATVPAPAAARGHSLPASQPRVPSALDRIQVHANRAIAETLYQARRLGAATIAGIAAVVLALTLFIANNLPQGSAIAALRGQLSHLAPALKGAAAPLSGSALAALPSRGDAPAIVAKILEEARAAGVDLPRGQYEYLPARDGVAARYRMTFPVHATYPQLREFMDRTLVALPAVAVEGMRIERKTVGDPGVDAELRLSAYVRSDE
ncbi:MAG: hypothetical protein KGJ52_03985 [Gammaproteobacteria bacterium]|nr:hypothetical protein [Gammaproteobacteria bacterium]